jgi:hypothetical protein
MEDMKIGIVMRQTEYDRETAESKLKEHNWNEMDVIREFTGGKKETPYVPSSTNQKLYAAFREHMSLA